MKKLIMIIAATAIFTGTVNAQAQKEKPRQENNQSKTPADLAKNRTNKMIERFAFPKDLFEKIYPLKLERITLVKKAKETSPPNKELMKQANKKYVDGLKSVLTLEQFAKVKAAWEEAKAKRKEGKAQTKEVVLPEDE
jgi:hypothetical protein